MIDYFAKRPFRVGQVRGSAYDAIVIVQIGVGENRDLVRVKRGKKTQELHLEKIEHWAVLGHVSALEALGPYNKGWTEVCDKWRWTHPLLGTAQRQRWHFDAITPAGERLYREPSEYTSRFFSCRTDVYRHLWEHAMRERTLSYFSRPRTGVLAVPGGF